jgi:hypothetical protein
MRKIVVSEFVSLDGVIEEPDRTFPYLDIEIVKARAQEVNAKKWA